MPQPALPCSMLVLTCMTCTLPAGAREPTAGQSPATRPAASRPTTQDAADEKLIRDVEASLAVIPQDVRDGKREGTGEQQKIMKFVLFLQLNSDSMPERVKQAEKNRQNGKEQMAAVLKAAEEMRAKMAKEPPALREASDKAIAAQVKALQLFQRVTGSGIPAGLTADQTGREVAKVIRDLPRDVREMIKAEADAKYHSQRLNLLESTRDLRREASTRPSSETRAAAHEALLNALDAKYQAQQRVIELTPLGGLEDSMVE